MKDETTQAPITTPPDAPRAKQRRGFACMSPEVQRAIASKGGTASHALGRGHEWTSEEATRAGRLGGTAARGGRGKATAIPAPTDEDSPRSPTEK